MAQRGRILWVDDDGPGRFRYADAMLKRDGWDIDWSHDAFSAAKRLCVHPYDVLILDQDIPLAEGEPHSRWVGTMLLHWLRQSIRPPVELPRMEQDRYRRLLQHSPPLSPNQNTFVVAVSDYDALELLNAMRGASFQDQELPILSKPLDIARLKAVLGRSLREAA